MRVVIARPELRPTEFADSHLFVHKQKASAAPVSQLPTLKTALSIDPSTKTDATDSPAAAKRDDLVTGTVRGPAPAATPQATASAGAPTDPSAAPTLNDVLKVAVDGAALRGGDLGPTDPAAGARPADLTAPIAADDDVPLPLSKPATIVGGGSGPISIFVSRKEGKIFARQDFTPLFEAPVKIERPRDPLGTHVFTALDYMPDHSTFRWNVVTLPPEGAKVEQHFRYLRDAWGTRRRELVEEPAAEPTQRSPETPQQALARIQIPQDVIDLVSELIVPGSSLVVSDHNLGEETDPSGTDFIVITR